MVIRLIILVLFSSLSAQEDALTKHPIEFKHIQFKLHPFEMVHERLITSFENPAATSSITKEKHKNFYTQRYESDVSRLRIFFQKFSPTTTNLQGLNLADLFLENRATVLAHDAKKPEQRDAYTECYLKPMVRFLDEAGVPFTQSFHTLYECAQKLHIADMEPFISIIFSERLIKAIEVKDIDTINQLSSSTHRFTSAALESAQKAFLHALYNYYKDSHSKTLTLALINLPIDINAQDKHGYTALHLAATISDTQTVIALLKHKDIDVNLANKKKITTPLESAKLLHRNTIVELLEAHLAKTQS